MHYVDVDALCKLAHWGIAAHLPEILSCTWSDISTVSSLRFRAQRAVAQPDGKLLRTSDAAQAVLQCIAAMPPLPDPDTPLLEQFTRIAQVDPGEAVLLAAAAADPAGTFITGDKRALRAIARLPQAALIAGKVIILEQLLDRCITIYGRDWLLEHIREDLSADKAVAMIVGSQCAASIDELNAGLKSYIAEIRDLCAPSMIRPG